MSASATTVKSYCNGCKKPFTQQQLKFMKSVAYVSVSDLIDTEKRNIISELSIRSWRWLCPQCTQCEHQQNEIHIRSNRGKVITAGSREWIDFCSTYSDIAQRLNLGSSKDKYNQSSLFGKQSPENETMTYGRYKSFAVQQLFSIAEATVAPVAHSNDEGDAVYNTKGSKFSSKELETFLTWLAIAKYDGIMKKADWFKERELPEHMKSKGFPFRKPESYDSLLTRLSKTGQSHKLLQNSKRWDQFKSVMDAIKKAQQEKYNMDTTKQSSVDAAKSGIFCKDPRSEKQNQESQSKTKNMISRALQKHSVDVKDKKTMEYEKLNVAKMQCKSLEHIGSQFKFINMTSDDYWGELILFVTMEYEPQSQVKSILNVIESKKNLFCSIWGAAFDKKQKIKLIKQTVQRVTNADS